MACLKNSSLISHSKEETEDLGFNLGKTLKPNDIVCFFGELGAGKTTFIKGLVRSFAEIDSDNVNSPTFVYLNIYAGVRTVYHFDLYRLQGPADFIKMGFDEYFESGGVACIEWSERIQAILPENCIKVQMTHVGENIRKIAYEKNL